MEKPLGKPASYVLPAEFPCFSNYGLPLLQGMCQPPAARKNTKLHGFFRHLFTHPWCILLPWCALTLSVSALAAPVAPIAAMGIRLAFDPPTLDWNLGDVPIHVINNVVEGLYRVSENGAVLADEAESMPRKHGDHLWRIRLRAGLKWSDGSPVTAADYVYSWQRLRDPALGSTYAELLSGIEQVRAVDTHELELHAREIEPAIFTHWTTFPMRKETLYNGPYRISAHQPGVKIELSPNPFHRAPGCLARIDAWIVQDDTTALRLYESGKIHFMPELSSLDRDRIATRADFHSSQSPVLAYLGVDASMLDASERHALSQAIDRDKLLKALGGVGSRAHGITPDAKQTFNEPAKITRKKLVFGYFEKGNNRVIAEFLQQTWKRKLGIEVELKSSEVKTYWQKLAMHPYPVFLNTYGPAVWNEIFYYRLLLSTNPMNMGRWSDSSYDRAVEKRDYKNAKSILTKEMPVLPLYFRAYDYLMSPKLKDVVVNPMTSLDLARARLEGLPSACAPEPSRKPLDNRKTR